METIIITLSAPLGCGKSTYANKLAKQLRLDGKTVEVYNEPVEGNIYLGVPGMSDKSQGYFSFSRKLFYEKNLDNVDYIIEDTSVMLDNLYRMYYDTPEIQLIPDFYFRKNNKHLIIERNMDKNLDMIKQRNRVFETENLDEVERIVRFIKQGLKNQLGFKGMKTESIEIPYVDYDEDVKPYNGDEFKKLFEVMDRGLSECNKYAVVSGAFENGNLLCSSTNTKIKNGIPNNMCSRIVENGSDSNKYRDAECCNSIHSEQALMMKLIDKRYYLNGEPIKLFVTAHPCYNCMKTIIFANNNYNLKIEEINYIYPKCSDAVENLAKQNGIKMNCWYDDKNISQKDY